MLKLYPFQVKCLFASLFSSSSFSFSRHIFSQRGRFFTANNLNSYLFYAGMSLEQTLFFLRRPMPMRLFFLAKRSCWRFFFCSRVIVSLHESIIILPSLFSLSHSRLSNSSLSCLMSKCCEIIIKIASIAIISSKSNARERRKLLFSNALQHSFWDFNPQNSGRFRDCW